MSKFTPGPWDVETRLTSIGRCHLIHPFKGCVYEDSNFSLTHQTEQMANAKLMAAAPDMYTALMAMRQATSWHEQEKANEAAIRAIAKAEGRAELPEPTR